MANAGVVSMVVSPGARRRNLLLCPFRSRPSVVQDWPVAGMNCRSSVQTGHVADGASDGGYWVPQAVQMKAGMGAGYTNPARAGTSRTMPADSPRREGRLTEVHASRYGNASVGAATRMR